MTTQTNGTAPRTLEVPTQTQQLATRPATAIEARSDRYALEPGSFNEAWQVSKVLADSGILPRAMSKPEAVMAAIMLGRDFGLSAMQSARSIHVIEGKASLDAATIVGICKRETKICTYFQLLESSAEIAVYETRRVGEPKPTKMSFTIEQARAANLAGKQNWKSYPDAMLRARAATALARAVYPDLVAGLYDPEELERPEPIDVTPKGEATTTRAPEPKRSRATPKLVETPPPEQSAPAPEHNADTGVTDENPVLDAAQLAQVISECASGESLATAAYALTNARRAGMDSTNFGRLYEMLSDRAESDADWRILGAIGRSLKESGRIDEGEYKVLARTATAAYAERQRQRNAQAGGQ